MNTLDFAHYELKRYTAQMGIYPEVLLLVDTDRFNSIENAELDDAFEISVKNGIGSIYATNPRAILMGVYHFLKVQGCRFLRPGKNGEYIPQVDKVTDCRVTIYAKYRHRGTTDWSLAGGIDCVFDFIDWLPKTMMNTYMIEYADYYQSVLSTYRFTHNPYKKPKQITRELFNKWDRQITEEIKKRGLIRHGAGHGFTVMLMDGITEVKNVIQVKETNDTQKCTNTEILAEIGGKRELFKGVPLNTNLCLSQEKVRKAFAEKVCEYSEKHPEIDYLHVWLADSFSNYCECENCRKLNQSDWYVATLNEIDKLLTEKGSKQKIVFLVYFELLYPPKQERILNEDRFVMLFCPYRRDFRKGYENYTPKPYTPALNKFTWDDMNGDLYISQLRDWKKLFKGECIVFDYTLFTSENYIDFTNLTHSSVAAADTLYLKNMGINGKIECGNVTAMSPTSLVLYSIAEALFYGTKTSEKDFFGDMFGKNNKVYDLMREVSDIQPYEYFKCIKNKLDEEELSALKKALTRINEFKAELFQFETDNKFHRINYEYLFEYLNIVEFLFNSVIVKFENPDEFNLEHSVEELKKVIFKAEELMPSYLAGLDLFQYTYKILNNKYERIEF